MVHLAPLPNLLEAINGAPFPASANELLAQAERNHAAHETIKLLRNLPDRQYRNASEVNHALGKVEELPDPEQSAWSVAGSQDMEDELPQTTRQ